MKISFESTAARPSFSISRTVMALRSNSVKNRVMPLRGLAGSRSLVRVRRRMRLACWALVVQTFRPLTTQRSPFFSARVRMREVSVPEFGSVTPNDMMVSPVTILGSSRRLSSSVP